MKVYRNPETGDKQKVDETDDAAIASLEAQGYVPWGAAEIKARLQERQKAVEEAQAQLAAAQAEDAALHPQPEPDLLMPKPLNPAAQVEAEPPTGATVPAPAVPKQQPPAPPPPPPPPPKKN